jgi:hypothetical protein
LDGLQPQKRGPRANLEAAEVARLKRENQRLRQKLRKAELIIEVQKKVSQILGLEEDELNSSRKSRDKPGRSVCEPPARRWDWLAAATIVLYKLERPNRVRNRPAA